MITIKLLKIQALLIDTLSPADISATNGCRNDSDLGTKN